MLPPADAHPARPSPPVVGVVLAAGAATRFGGGKAVARYQGERLVDRAVATLTAGGCDRVLVVVGAQDVGAVHHAILVLNPDWTPAWAARCTPGCSRRAMPRRSW